MEQDVKEYVKCCPRCILAKTPEPSARAPLESFRTSAPMDLVCLDFWSAEDNKQRSVDVLVVTDHFTKLAHAFPCMNQTAKQVAKKLWDHVFCVYGFPERIHTDQGANFESELIAELLRLAGVTKSRTTAYHPMGNGGTERFNRMLGSMLRSLPLREKDKWPQQIQTLTFAYNATMHKTTGYAPFQLMFGRVPRLPVDVMFKRVLHDPVVVDYKNYVRTLVSHLHEAAGIAQEHAVKEQDRQARGYNRKVKGTCIDVGARVLIANKGVLGKRKLADKWSPRVYTVRDRNLHTHTYRVENDEGVVRVVHRNLILDISFLPVGEDVEQGDTSVDLGGDESESGPLDQGHSYFSSVNDVDLTVSQESQVEDSSVETDSESSIMSEALVGVVGGRLHTSDMSSDEVSESQQAEQSGLNVHAPRFASSSMPSFGGDGCDISTTLQDVASSRRGRVRKPVHRLIESMGQVMVAFFSPF